MKIYSTLSLALLGMMLCSAASFTQTIRFAVIGDYGSAGRAEADVAQLVKSWNPDFVITVGDNNYDNGAASTIDANIGQYYSQFISPYLGSYGTGGSTNRFFPSLGNHDWYTSGALPYLNYFTLPGNERYYNLVRGPVELFAIDSDPSEPNGTSSTSTQARWLQSTLAGSTAKWKLVYFHHPPYSSGIEHGSTSYMQWPFQSWGATAVLSGHEHNYERIIRNGFPYFVDGLGGASLYGLGSPISGSMARFDSDYGAMLVTANSDSIAFEFYTRSNSRIDRYVVRTTSTPPPPSAPILAAPANGATSQLVSPTLTWNASSGATSYRLQVSTSAAFTSLVVNDSTGTTTSRLIGPLVNNTTYYWRVNAKNSGGTSAYSSAWSFTTQPGLPPPPSAPILAAPANGATNQLLSPALTWNASSGATSYRLQVSTSAAFTTLVVNDSTVTTTSRLIGPLVNNTTYYWRVNAKNSGGTSAYSSAWSFSTQPGLPPPPSAPILAAPASGATNQLLSPALTWNASSGATSYRLQASTNVAFTSLVVDDSTVTTTSRQIGPLVNNTTYYWRVNAKNVGGTSTWSTTWSFTTAASAAVIPPAPTLTSPATGATGVATNPSLIWNASSGAASYRVQVSSGPAFTSNLLDQSGVTSTSVSASGLLNNTIYYWRVNATNSAGTSGWSGTGSFTTTPGSVSTPDLWISQDGLLPPWKNKSWSASVNFKSTEQKYAGSTSVKVVQNPSGGLSVHSGSSTSPVPVNPALYSRFEFAVNGSTTGGTIAVLFENDLGYAFPKINCGDIPVNQWVVISLPMSQLNPTNQTIHRVDIMEMSGTKRKYYVDNIRFVGIGTVESLPATPALASPANGAAGVATNPSLSWNTSSGAASYRVQVSTVAAFTSNTIDQSGVTSTSISASGLLNNTLYFWRVNAANSAGTSAWSGTRSFTTTAGSVPTSDLWISRDGLESPWIDASWNATGTYLSTEQTYAGSTSAKIIQGTWGGLSMRYGVRGSSPGINPGLYSKLEFAVNGGTTGGTISVLFENDQGYAFPKISYGSIPANQWVVVSVPMSQMNPTNQIIHRVDIMEMSGTPRTYYVDNIRLVGSLSAGASAAQIVTQPSTTGANGSEVPTAFALAQNFPNPFNPSTTIQFDLPSPEHVTLKVYNSLGQQVATLVDEELSTGRYTRVWNAGALASGPYICRLTAGNFVETRMLQLVK